MGTIYDLVADAKDGGTRSFGASNTRSEAEARLSADVARYRGSSWTNFRITEVDTSGLFEVPSLPTPRERYSIAVEVTKSRTVGEREVPRAVRVDIREGERVVASYERNYAMLRTFEPFRQGDRDYALISPDYTATSVVDLQTGQIVAAEEPNSWGFCPVGFYVPDWWDVHTRTTKAGTLPGSGRWTSDHEWPTGDFGFVWGCVWGDDSSWKVQYLDLSAIAEGVLQREERFGYVMLDTGEKEGHEVWRDAHEFVSLESFSGQRRVQFRTRQVFDIGSGEPLDPLA